MCTERTNAIARARHGLVVAWIAGALLAAPCAAADSQPAVDHAYIAELIAAAHARGDFFPDLYRINPGLDDSDLYAVQKHYVARQLAAGASVIGYKGGFIPRAPIAGVMLDGGRLESGASISRQDFRLLVIEAEIAFRFCRDVSAPLATVEALRAAVCELAPALEVADGALADFAAVKSDFRHLRQALLPINVGYSHVLIGAPVAAAGIDLDRLAVTVRHGAHTLGQRSLDASTDLWASVLWVVNHFVLAEGYTLRAGHYIIPGNLTGIHVGDEGRYHSDFGPLGGVELNVMP